ncbi:hypothetical protein V1523DRAFT_429190 [Lipomyces doorenjongii]
MSQKVADVREQMKQDWDRHDSHQLDREWLSSDDSTRAQRWPKRYLLISFLTLEEYRRRDCCQGYRLGKAMEKAAPDMGIAIETIRSPLQCTETQTENMCPPSVILFLDWSRKLFMQMLQECVRSFNESIKGSEKQAAFEQDYSLFSKNGDAQGSIWDVEGAWSITCPYIEQQWGSDDNACNFEIGIVDDGDYLQIYVTFQFIVLTGVMRFVNSKAPPSQEIKDLEDVDCYDEKSDCEHEQGRHADLENSAQFLFS